MSDREWRFYVTDMVGFCEKVLTFTRDQKQAVFVADAMRFDATVRNAHPAIPWRMLIATRNQLIHGYLGLDNDILWSIVQTDVPALLQQLKLIESHPL